MSELFTHAEVQAHLRYEVEAAGGAAKWMRKNGFGHKKYIQHMFANGDAATLPDVLLHLGFKRVERFMPIVAKAEAKP